MQVDLCRHIKTNGLQCRAVALKQNVLCYFHARLHGAHARFRNHVASEPGKAFGNWITLPPLEDREAIQIALSKVVSGLALGLIEDRRAAVLLYGLQLSATNAKGLRIGHCNPRIAREVLIDPAFGAESPHIAPPGRTVEIEELVPSDPAELDRPSEAPRPAEGLAPTESSACIASPALVPDHEQPTTNIEQPTTVLPTLQAVASLSLDLEPRTLDLAEFALPPAPLYNQPNPPTSNPRPNQPPAADNLQQATRNYDYHLDPGSPHLR